MLISEGEVNVTVNLGIDLYATWAERLRCCGYGACVSLGARV